MSDYKLKHNDLALLNDIEKDISSLYASKNIWIEHPLSYQERLGWIKTPTLIKESIRLCKSTFDEVVKNSNPSSVVFIGMGGSIQTGKVLNQISLKSKYQLIFLDSTNPKDISVVREKIDLPKTLFVFMSKSGTTLETNKVMDFFIKELSEEGESDYRDRFIVLTDAKNSLDKFAIKNNFLKVINTPKNIGGRFSSATPFGVFPATFMNEILTYLENNSLWNLNQIKKKCTLLTSVLKNSYDNHNGVLNLEIPEEISQMGIWLEQIIAESTGKNGKGITPIINNDSNIGYPKISINNNSEKKYTSTNTDELIISFNKKTILEDMFIWQTSVSILCKYMSIFPFDEPDVTRSKINTENILKKHKEIRKVTIPYSRSDINNIINENKTNRVLYINLYLNETKKINGSLDRLKEKLSFSHGIRSIAGFGPRYLHSVGQLQKGGPKDVWSIFFYDENLINSYNNKNNYRDLSDTFKAQMLGDLYALIDLEINTYLVNIDSNNKDPFENLINKIKE
ncbi:MAG: hypothetical protein CL762_04315 [Chloroflexi bacterium]|nr:hypothetical protein [Chloroflexota bacterium]